MTNMWAPSARASKALTSVAVVCTASLLRSASAIEDSAIGGFANDTVGEGLREGESVFRNHPFSVFCGIVFGFCCVGVCYLQAVEFLCKKTDHEMFLPGNGGKLEVTCHCARELRSTDTTEIDPYCVVSTGCDQKKCSGHIHKTAVHVQGGANPEWEHKMHFNLTNADLMLIVFVWDADFFSKDDEVGHATICLKDIAELENGKCQEKEFEVTHLGEPAGTIVLTLHLHGNLEFLQKTILNPHADGELSIDENLAAELEAHKAAIFSFSSEEEDEDDMQLAMFLRLKERAIKNNDFLAAHEYQQEILKLEALEDDPDDDDDDSSDEEPAPNVNLYRNDPYDLKNGTTGKQAKLEDKAAPKAAPTKAKSAPGAKKYKGLKRVERE